MTDCPRNNIDKYFIISMASLGGSIFYCIVNQLIKREEILKIKKYDFINSGTLIGGFITYNIIKNGIPFICIKNN